MEETENRLSEVERRETEGKRYRESLDAEMEYLQKELTNYKMGEEEHWAKKEMSLKLPEFFDLLDFRSISLLEQGFKGVVI